LRRIFIVTLALIVYGSLYPWQFHPTEFAVSPFWLLLHSWPAALNRFVVRDGIVNVGVYVPLGIFGYLAFVQHWRKAGAAAAALLVSLAVSTGVEMAQLFEPSRYCSAVDVVCNVTGGAIGIVLALFHRRSTTSVVFWSEIEAFLRPSEVTILLLCWIGYQTMPLFPQLSTTQLMHKLASLRSSLSWSPLEIVASTMDWLAVIALIDEVAGPARTAAISAAALLLLPARLLLDTRSLTAAECIGAAAAWILWGAFLRRLRNRYHLLAWCSVGVLLLRGLTPFHFTSAQSFSWTPFAASLSFEHASAVIVLFNKAFLYGTAIWLLRNVGYPYAMGAIGIAALLAVIEAVQIYLPGRTPEITDPLLALTMAVILHFAGRQKKSGVKPA
jgi:VanZ family protein